MAQTRWKRAVVYWMILAGLFGTGAVKAQGPVEYPGPAPGEARASVRDGEIRLSNDILECRWTTAGRSLRPVSIQDRQSAALSLEGSECFQILLADGRTLKASALKIADGPHVSGIANQRTRRLAEEYGGRQVWLMLTTPDNTLAIRWQIELRNGSNYVRQRISLEARRADVDLREIVLVQLKAPGAQAVGILDGSPVTVADRYFLAFEHPLSRIRTLDAELLCALSRSAPLKPRDRQLDHSSVMGIVPPGQLRRGFLYYVERERAQPCRPFLHYNSWYDIGYGPEKILEPEALKVIDLFGKELIERRGMGMDSFVWDDGWDDPATLWRFHDGFPQGFVSLERAAKRYNSAIGAWLSPWGGYGQPKEERMKYGRQEGFETNERGFSMAGPKYYARFRDACVRMIRDYDLNYFKFDGISSSGAPTGAPAEFAPDIQALLRLIGDLRQAKPSLFINVTTGTWSSPYWLWYADSTWRSGNDWGACGWGSKRQEQITYRDAQTWQNVVQRAPLYPLNSLMTQGVMFANHGLPDEPNGMTEDIRAFFASGTNCQELYLTPSLLDARTWDVLAEAARWAKDNADVLVDTHWVGGNPAQGEVYGWASWSRRKGILALRNPADRPRSIAVDAGTAFELPEGAARTYSLKSPWKEDAAQPGITLVAGKDHTFELKPFEVLVFDATPQ